MTLGPVQILVVGFVKPRFEGKILEELRRLREQDIVRLLDVLVVAKDDDGNVQAVESSDLPLADADQFGRFVRALVGFGGAEPLEAALDDEEIWDVIDTIPNGSVAAIALLEHRWAIPLRDAIDRAGGTAFADAWVHRDDLAAIGLEPAAAGRKRP